MASLPLSLLWSFRASTQALLTPPKHQQNQQRPLQARASRDCPTMAGCLPAEGSGARGASPSTEKVPGPHPQNGIPTMYSCPSPLLLLLQASFTHWVHHKHWLAGQEAGFKGSSTSGRLYNLRRVL